MTRVSVEVHLTEEKACPVKMRPTDDMVCPSETRSIDDKVCLTKTFLPEFRTYATEVET